MRWLADPPPKAPRSPWVPCRTPLAAFGSLGLPVLHRLKIDELLQQRADRIDDALVPMLLDVKLPLPMHLGTVAQGLIGLRAELGETWLPVAGDADKQEAAKKLRNKALRLLTTREHSRDELLRKLAQAKARLGYKTLFGVNGLPSVELRYHYPGLKKTAPGLALLAKTAGVRDIPGLRLDREASWPDPPSRRRCPACQPPGGRPARVSRLSA